MSLQLYIGNKNYSSWSMRPWVLMRQLGIAFEEIQLRFDFSEGSAFRQAVARVSPAGKVPVLVDDGFAVWDTLAITEYLHEKFPALGVWPTAPRERARARSLCAEMHSGFGALRGHCPMNVEASLAEVGKRVWSEQPELRRDMEHYGTHRPHVGTAAGRQWRADAVWHLQCRRRLLCARMFAPGDLCVAGLDGRTRLCRACGRLARRRRLERRGAEGV
jgi:glutathione S-transferase